MNEPTTLHGKRLFSFLRSVHLCGEELTHSDILNIKADICDVEWEAAKKEAERADKAKAFRDELLGLVLDRERQRDAEKGRADKAEAALERAYLCLVSVQPAAHRTTMLHSPNDAALRLNIILEDAIQAWVDDYVAAYRDVQ